MHVLRLSVVMRAAVLLFVAHDLVLAARIERDEAGALLDADGQLSGDAAPALASGVCTKESCPAAEVTWDAQVHPEEALLEVGTKAVAEMGVEELEAEAQRLTTENEALEAELARLDKENAAMEAQIAGMEGQSDAAMQAEAARLTKENEHLEAEISRVDAENAELESKIKAIEAGKAGAKAVADMTDAEMHAEAARIAEDNAALEAEVARLDKENAHLEAQLAARGEHLDAATGTATTSPSPPIS